MKAMKKSEPYEIRDDKNTKWNYDRKAMLQTAAVVAVGAVVIAAIFMRRKQMMNAILNSGLYASGLALTQKIADTAGTVTHKVADTASALTHKVMDTADAVTHNFAEHAGVGTLN